MKLIRRVIPGSAMLMVAMACSAQTTTIPLMQIARDASNPALSARAALPPNPAARAVSDSALSESSTSGGLLLSPHPARKAQTLSTRYFLLNGLNLGMAVFDVEMTQHCIANRHCAEGNPLMPSSQAGQLGVNFALVGSGAFLSYRLKKQNNKMWILSPLVGISAHAAGVVSGFKNR